MKYRDNKEFAKLMDQNDPLKELRQSFLFPQYQGKDMYYFCGHSLGLQPKAASEYVAQELEAWKTMAVEAHFKSKNPWMYYHELLTHSMARLIEAKPVEVVTMNSLTTNLHLMMVSFYQPTLDKGKILIEDQAFPSDRYAVESHMRTRGFDPEHELLLAKPLEGESFVSTDAIVDMIQKHGDTIDLVLLGAVNYFTGQSLDIRRIVREAHAKECKVGLDLAHAIGNTRLKLHDWNVDFAVWCTYKYLNGGPGNVGGCFVHERHAEDPWPRYAGWWGHDQQTRFKMPDQFVPTPGAEGWQLSNPPILPLAALRASMDIFDQASMEKLRAKSKLLTGYLEFLMGKLNTDDITQITSDDPSQRGCQLSFEIGPKHRDLNNALKAHGVICDWREPNTLRIAPVPLYNSFMDVWQAVQIIKGVI